MKRGENDFERRERERAESERLHQENGDEYRLMTREAIKSALAEKRLFVLIEDRGYSSLWSTFRHAVCSVANERQDVVASVAFHAVNDVHFDGHALLTLRLPQ